MDSLLKANAQLDKVLKPLFQNKTSLALILLVLTVYSCLLAPKLPNSVILFFDTTIGKLLFIFLIAFVATRNVPNNITISLMVSVGFLVTLSVLNNLKMKEAFQNMGREHFDLMEQTRKMVNQATAENDSQPEEEVVVDEEEVVTEAPADEEAPKKTKKKNNAPMDDEEEPVEEENTMTCQAVIKKCLDDKSIKKNFQLKDGAGMINVIAPYNESQFDEYGCDELVSKCMRDEPEAYSKTTLVFPQGE